MFKSQVMSKSRWAGDLWWKGTGERCVDYIMPVLILTWT
jgi:hypothetical protein